MDAPVLTLDLAYGWRVGLRWFYTTTAAAAPANAEEMELLLLDGGAVLRHEVGDTTEVIWGAREFVPALRLPNSRDWNSPPGN